MKIKTEILKDAKTFHAFKEEAKRMHALAEELKEVHLAIQPLLYAISVKLYGDNNEAVSLQKLIEDGVNFINGESNE